MEERIIELELRTMQQQEQLQQLSEVLYAQQRTLDAVHAQLARLHQKLQAEPGLVDAAVNDRPPHY